MPPARLVRFRRLATTTALTTTAVLGISGCGTVPAPTGYVTAMPHGTGVITHAPTTTAPMDEDRFWSIIAGTGPTGSAYGRAKTLRASLEKLPPDQIVQFDRHLTKAVDSIGEPRHLGAAEVIMGFTSEDAFVSFRAWVVSQGKHVHARFKQHPDSVVEVAIEREGELVAGQMVQFASHTAYKTVTGRTMVADVPDLPSPRRIGSTVDGPSYAQLAKDLPRLARAYLPTPAPPRNAFADGPRGIRRHG